MAGLAVEAAACPTGERPACDFTGAMMIIGRRTAMVAIGLSREAATLTVSQMTGLAPEELSEEDLADGVAELINIIAGSGKSGLVGTDEHYRITLPFVMVGQNRYTLYKNKAADRCLRVFAGDVNLILEIAYLEGEP
ncbi:chemotaxis protein CheX [Heliobacterium gestii]|uniref:Chemotaxis protein CheX n=1 Tax=Heliomicrobium gestii TaxID=2699 RepID=A0A845LCF3_HELGE|nr:chemotaxis protein CheX [Heliomicrobium gestii]MBM7866073.1 chemotaxis protein CheX [Heliomicrobium gestii]MZP42600.1 chemotaxis protein CheX [Heliomicrobium gestii]